MPREHAVAALEDLGTIRDQASPVLQIAADELWLSPAFHRDVFGIHFTWVTDAPAVLPVLGSIEERLAPFDARPHWGELFTTPAEVVRLLYPRLPDFIKFARDVDPAGKLRNDFVDRLLFGSVGERV